VFHVDLLISTPDTRIKFSFWAWVPHRFVHLDYPLFLCFTFILFLLFFLFFHWVLDSLPNYQSKYVGSWAWPTKMYKTTKQNIIIIIIAVLRGHLIIIIIFQVGAGGQHIDLDGTLELVVGKIFGAHQAWWRICSWKINSKLATHQFINLINHI